GYPLALSLVSDLYGGSGEGADALPSGPGGAPPPDIVQSLLERFVDSVPGPAHRAALEACALLRITTESVLARVLDLPDGHDLFDWLRGLSFIEPAQPGVCPHSVAREALIADLRWRNPDRYADLHRRARAYYGYRLRETAGQDRE